MVVQVNNETNEVLNSARLQSIFTDTDYLIARQAVAKLSGHEHSVVMLRFWENQSMAKIADFLDLTLREVERHLNKALARLKKICAENPEFSKSHDRERLVPLAAAA